MLTSQIHGENLKFTLGICIASQRGALAPIAPLVVITKESGSCPWSDFSFVSVIFAPGPNEGIRTGWSHCPVQMSPPRGVSGPSPTHLVQMPHIRIGWCFHPIQMWRCHIYTEWGYTLIQMWRHLYRARKCPVTNAPTSLTAPPFSPTPPKPLCSYDKNIYLSLSILISFLFSHVPISFFLSYFSISPLSICKMGARGVPARPRRRAGATGLSTSTAYPERRGRGWPTRRRLPARGRAL
jgi:hypothetical protein